MIPGAPTNYAGEVDITTVTLTWANGANAQTIRHEVADDGVNWQRLDDDTVPTITSDHSLPEQNKVFYLRAKSRNADGDSGYTPVIQVKSGVYEP